MPKINNWKYNNTQSMKWKMKIFYWIKNVILINWKLLKFVNLYYFRKSDGGKGLNELSFGWIIKYSDCLKINLNLVILRW